MKKPGAKEKKALEAPAREGRSYTVPSKKGSIEEFTPGRERSTSRGEGSPAP